MDPIIYVLLTVIDLSTNTLSFGNDCGNALVNVKGLLGVSRRGLEILDGRLDGLARIIRRNVGICRQRGGCRRNGQGETHREARGSSLWLNGLF